MSFLRKSQVAYDMSDPGTGKTAVYCIHNATRPARKRMLVVCPKTLMRSAWGNDMEIFAPSLTVSFAYAENRAQAFDLKTDVVVINTDGVKWLAKEGAKYLKEFDLLVIDEVTTYRDQSTQRSKAVRKLSKGFKFRYVLSGTPNPKSVTELWHPMILVDGGKRLGTSFVNFRNGTQTPHQVGPMANHLQWEDKPGIAQAVQVMLKDVVIRHSFEEVMTHVPPNHRATRSFTLSKNAKAVYDKLENDCILKFESGTITAVNAAVLRNKLLQVASGAVYTGDENSAYKLIDAERYELCADLISDVPHSVVFFNWKHQRDELMRAFKSRGITHALIDGSVSQKKREEIVTDYQAGKYTTLLLHPKTGAHGLTLTRGTLSVFVSPIYEADILKQAIHRIYRGAQDKPTNTVMIQASDTVEAGVYECLDGRYERMSDFLMLMKQNKGKKK